MPITAGSRLGRYEIRSKIGAGGMGEVYLARATKLARKVVLKILPFESKGMYRRGLAGCARWRTGCPRSEALMRFGEVRKVLGC